jgi:hypothetical protein
MKENKNNFLVCKCDSELSEILKTYDSVDIGELMKEIDSVDIGELMKSLDKFDYSALVANLPEPDYLGLSCRCSYAQKTKSERESKD